MQFNILIVIFFLFVFTINCDTHNNDFHLINVMDDSIGRTDYLMTLYSTVTNKPCLYFCKIIYFIKKILLY